MSKSLKRLAIIASFFVVSACAPAAPAPTVSPTVSPSLSQSPSADVTVSPVPVVSPTVQPVLINEKYLLDDTHSWDRENAAVTHIMVHYMSAVKVDFDRPYDMDLIARTFPDTGTSVHYVIDREGEVFRFVTEDRAAWHAGKGEWNGDPEYTNRMNYHSIGIELLGMGTREEMAQFEIDYDALRPEDIGFTDAQYESLTRLIAEIKSRNSGIGYIIGHDEYNPAKSDPGALFDWGRVR